MVAFDIATKVVADTQKIWALHPGRGKKFYGIFFENRKVFLEIPGFFPDPQTFDSTEAIRQHLRMSDAVLEYYRKGETVPTKNAATYDSAVGDKSFSSAVGNVETLYKEASPGDLILVPGRGHYAPVLIGEITSKFNVRDSIVHPSYPGHEIPVRKVRWLSTNIPKRQLDGEVAKRLENRHAICEIYRKLYGKHVFPVAYRSYVEGGKSKAEFLGSQYSGKDLLETYSSALLLKYFVASYNAVNIDDVGDLRNLSIQQTIDKYYDQNLIDDFTQDFQSPGRFVLYGATATIGIFLMLGVAVATSDATVQEILNNLNIVNSEAPPNDAVTNGFQDQFQYLMNSLGEERLNEIQQLGQKAAGDIGLDSGVKER